MAKNFFQDMIKMKSHLRQEMSDNDPVVKREIKKEVKEIDREEAPIRPKKEAPIKITHTTTRSSKITREPVEIEPSPRTEAHNWPPMMQNKVTRQVELAVSNAPRRPRYSLWLVAIASLVFLFFAVSFLFSEAKITVTPKVAEESLNENFAATKDSAAGNNLAFDLISLPGEETRSVPGGEVIDVSLPARGTVIIYNNFNTTPQRLDIDTRLEGSNGKIYKTVKALTVPGMKGTSPGSVEVEVYGSQPGPSYNSGPLDFQIFGFKGTPKYGKFYARSKTDLTGGFIGKQSSITEDQKTVVVNEQASILKAKLLERARDLIPSGFVLLEGAVTFNVDEKTFGASEQGKAEVPVTVKGTLSGFLFDENELAKKVAATTMKDYDGAEVYIANLKDLTFTLLTMDSPGSLAKNITFNLAGNPKIVWKFDEGKLQKEIAGRSKADFNQILSTYPNVSSADVLLRPIWKRAFPEEASKITVTVNYP
jgi:hypothetical protein